MMDQLNRFLQKVKKYVGREGSAVVCLIVLMVYIGKTSNQTPERVKVCWLLRMLGMGLVDEITLKTPQEVVFKTNFADQWYSADVSLLSSRKLFQLVAQSHALFDTVPNRQSASYQSLLRDGLCLALSTFACIRFLPSYFYPSAPLSDYPTVSYDKIIGMSEQIEQLEPISKFLLNPQQCKNVGAQLIQQVSIVGPPGSGKTLLAQALAGESGITLISSTLKTIQTYCQDIINAEPCIVILRHQVPPSRLPPLLRGRRIVIVYTQLEPNQQNPSTQIVLNIELPSSSTREQLLHYFLQNVHNLQQLDQKPNKLEPTEFSTIAMMTAGFSPADISKLADRAAYAALARNSQMITLEDFCLTSDRANIVQ